MGLHGDDRARGHERDRDEREREGQKKRDIFFTIITLNLLTAFINLSVPLLFAFILLAFYKITLVTFFLVSTCSVGLRVRKIVNAFT